MILGTSRPLATIWVPLIIARITFWWICLPRMRLRRIMSSTALRVEALAALALATAQQPPQPQWYIMELCHGTAHCAKKCISERKQNLPSLCSSQICFSSWFLLLWWNFLFNMCQYDFVFFFNTTRRFLDKTYDYNLMAHMIIYRILCPLMRPWLWLEIHFESPYKKTKTLNNHRASEQW